LMGRERIALTAPGDEVELGFGQDDRVRVEHVPVKRLEEGPRLLSDRRTDTRSFKTTITNFHDTPVSVRVLNRIPFSEQESIEVTEIEASPKRRRAISTMCAALWPGTSNSRPAPSRTSPSPIASAGRTRTV